MDGKSLVAPKDSAIAKVMREKHHKEALDIINNNEHYIVIGVDKDGGPRTVICSDIGTIGFLDYIMYQTHKTISEVLKNENLQQDV